MSSNKTDDAVAEYLYELELRLSGLPVLQRRELLADLEAHITNERAERRVVSESEVLEILERLGSPEVVAAAAYEEAGMLQPLPGGRSLVSRRPVPARPAYAFAGDGPPAPYSLPPVPPPPDEPISGPYPPAGPSFASPPFTGPPYFAGSPLGAPKSAAPAKPVGPRIAVVVALVAAVVILFGCLAGAFFASTSSVQDAPVGTVDMVPMEPAVPAEPAAPRLEG